MRWRIVCYHRVEADHAQALRRQLAWFRDRGHRFCSLDEGLAALGSGRGGKLLTVSFDDGDASVCLNAQPVLDEMGVSAVLYVVSDYIEQGRTYRDADPRPAASWDQLQRWLDAGHCLASHSHTHAPMSRCSPQRRAREWEQSAELIQQHTGRVVEHFSYPWGQHDAATLAQLREAGRWRSAATIDRGWNRPGVQPLALRRDVIEPTWTPAQVRLKLLAGSLGPLYNLQRRLRKPHGYWDQPDTESFE